MKKGKNWLKAQIKHEEIDLKYAFDNYVHYEKVLIADDVNELINKLEEPEQEKVVVPQFVADWIEDKKDWTAFEVFYDIDEQNIESDKVSKWLYDNDDEKNAKREIVLLQALRSGYTVEKEKLYRVKVDQGPNYLYVESLHLYSDVIKPLDFNYKFSAKEHALKFASRNQAKGVAELVGGEVEEVTE